MLGSHSMPVNEAFCRSIYVFRVCLLSLKMLISRKPSRYGHGAGTVARVTQEHSPVSMAPSQVSEIQHSTLSDVALCESGCSGIGSHQNLAKNPSNAITDKDISLLFLYFSRALWSNFQPCLCFNDFGHGFCFAPDICRSTDAAHASSKDVSVINYQFNSSFLIYKG